MKLSKKYLFASIISFTLFVNEALACACGCGIFNVGTSSLIPNGEGGTAFLQYDYMSQTRNWNKTESSNGHNHDRRIETQSVTAGMQYMFNRKWGAALRVPYVTRQVINQPHHGTMTYDRHSDVGDIRINGIYAGFFDDMSTGITFGLKLPTGSTNSKTFERNTQIGTGSTDTILGAYHRGNFGKSNLGYFIQTSWERPFATHQGYTPGYEISSAAGVFYNAGQFGFAKKVSPILQITNAKKGQDSGFADPSHNPNSGYNFTYFAPGVEVKVNDFRVYADIELPIRRSVNGNQLVPQTMYKLILGYDF